MIEGEFKAVTKLNSGWKCSFVRQKNRFRNRCAYALALEDLRDQGAIWVHLCGLICFCAGPPSSAGHIYLLQRSGLSPNQSDASDRESANIIGTARLEQV